LGVLKDKKSPNQRLYLPVLTETILNDNDISTTFESNMPMSYHSTFNQFLNSLVKEGSHVKYVHTKQIDSYVQQEGFGKVRKTVDQNTGKVLYLPNLDDTFFNEDSNWRSKRIFSQCEIRLSDISESRNKMCNSLMLVLEKQSKDDSSATERQKDRLTYTLDPFQIDLTQVISSKVYVISFRIMCLLKSCTSLKLNLQILRVLCMKFYMVRHIQNEQWNT
jgi:hypothetical protein